MKTQGVCQFCDVERCGSCIIALDTNSLLERERARSLDQLLSDAEIEAETARCESSVFFFQAAVLSRRGPSIARAGGGPVRQQDNNSPNCTWYPQSIYNLQYYHSIIL